MLDILLIVVYNKINKCYVFIYKNKKNEKYIMLYSKCQFQKIEFFR